MTDRPTIARLDWDSTFFGMPIGRVDPPLDADAARRVSADAVADRFDCVYLLVPSDDVGTIQAAELAGFRLVDVRVTLAADGPFPAPMTPRAPQAVVRTARVDDVPALEAIARCAHFDGRFHVDGRFGAERASALYAHWIARSCANRDGVVFVAEHRGVIAGYLTCERDRDGAGRIALVAVSPDARGQGLGQALVAQGLSWFQQASVSRVRVVTQGRNVSAQRLYQQAGFRTKSVDVWLHLWPGPIRGHAG